MQESTYKGGRIRHPGSTVLGKTAYRQHIKIQLTMKLLVSYLVAAAALAIAAPVEETTDAALKRRIDMVLCRREDFDDCTVYKDIDGDACSKFTTRQRIQPLAFSLTYGPRQSTSLATSTIESDQSPSTMQTNALFTCKLFFYSNLRGMLKG